MPPRSGRKGQAIIFENVLIFTIGVAIFVVCYAIFNIYQYTYFNPVGTGDQLEGTRDLIASHILLLAEKPANSTFVLDIPESVGPESYTIRLSPDGLNLTSALGISKASPLFGLAGAFDLSTRPPAGILSSEGRITLKKAGDQIYIS